MRFGIFYLKGNYREAISEYKLVHFPLILFIPSFFFQQEFLNLVDNNQVVVISGETGSGKTTQLPQYLLEHAILRDNGSCTRIVVTQPRRISAISVAERVASERGESLGMDIGYQVC